MPKESIDVAIESWQQQRVSLRPGASSVDIVAAFQDCGRPATEDVLDLYMRVDGFADGEYCKNHWSFWSLAKILEENRFNPSQEVWFADYLIYSHYFSLHPEDSETSSVFVQIYEDRDFETHKVADSLTDFLQRLVTNPESVYVFPLKAE